MHELTHKMWVNTLPNLNHYLSSGDATEKDKQNNFKKLPPLLLDPYFTKLRVILLGTFLKIDTTQNLGSTLIVCVCSLNYQHFLSR